MHVEEIYPTYTVEVDRLMPEAACVSSWSASSSKSAGLATNGLERRPLDPQIL